MKKLRPGQTPTQADFNRLIDEVTRNRVTSSDLIVEYSQHGTNLSRGRTGEAVFAVITGQQKDRYEWKQVTPSPDGWIEQPGGVRSAWDGENLDNPAYESGDIADVPPDTVVYMIPMLPYARDHPGGRHIERPWGFASGRQIEPFILTEDLVPRRYEGGYTADSPDPHVLTPAMSVRGYLTGDATQAPIDLWPATRTNRHSAELPLSLGVGRPGTNYHAGTAGWCRWVTRAYQDVEGGETRWRGQWQIVHLAASMIADARTLGPWNVDSSGTGPAEDFLIKENLTGLLSPGDVVRTENCTIANNRRFTVASVDWIPAAAGTLITVVEVVGGNFELTGTLGKIILKGQRGAARLWWQNQDVEAGSLVDSQYDIDVVNHTDVDVAAGDRLRVSFDRQAYNWEIIDQATQSLFVGYLDDDSNMPVARDGIYEIVWTKDLLKGGDIAHFDPSKTIELASPGIYEATVTIVIEPDGGNLTCFHLSYMLAGDVIHFVHSIDSHVGPWHAPNTIVFTHIFESLSADAELLIRFQEHNVSAVILHGAVLRSDARCSISVRRLRHMP